MVEMKQVLFIGGTSNGQSDLLELPLPEVLKINLPMPVAPKPLAAGKDIEKIFPTPAYYSLVDRERGIYKYREPTDK